MEPKPKVSPNATYIFDDEDIDQLDEFSISAVLEEAVLQADELGDEDDTMDALASLEVDDLDDTARAQVVSESREPTIDELLDAATPSDGDGGTNAGSVSDDSASHTGTHTVHDILLPPELLFPTHDDTES